MTITSLNIQDGTYKERRCRPRIKKRYVVALLVIIIILIIFAIYMLTNTGTKSKVDKLNPPNPQKPLPASESKLRYFPRGAVSSDAEVCSDIGKDILDINGTAIDATIATMVCNGLVTMQSMGLGGGFFMTIYSKHEDRVYALNAREAAPLAATEDMFSKNPNASKYGSLAVGVPGELKGYRIAYQMYGQLEWKDLIQPTINLCKIGYNISQHQARALKMKEEAIRNDTVLKEIFINSDGSLKGFGAKVIHTKYCETLEQIAKDPDDFYNGTLADMFVKDIQDMGGIITKEDMEKYEIKWEKPVSINLNDDDTFYSVPPPASGNILGFILNILQGYKFNENSIKGLNNTILTYHRIIEAFKFAFAQRTHLGDPGFVNITNLLLNLTSNDYAEAIRSQILDNATSKDPSFYGANLSTKDDHGTAHISVLAPNGDAVSVTSTINLYFGAAITSKSTGIILNSGMDDFSSMGFENYFGLPFSAANKIEPGKRPLSSMTPSIVIDRDNNVKMVIGAAGGTKIPTSVGLVIMKCLWFGENIKSAIDDPRFHHQLLPMEVSYEYGLTQPIVEGLEALGHKLVRSTSTGSVINGIFRKNGTIFANADYRKHGEVAGL